MSEPSDSTRFGVHCANTEVPDAAIEAISIAHPNTVRGCIVLSRQGAPVPARQHRLTNFTYLPTVRTAPPVLAHQGDRRPSAAARRVPQGQALAVHLNAQPGAD